MAQDGSKRKRSKLNGFFGEAVFKDRSMMEKFRVSILDLPETSEEPSAKIVAPLFLGPKSVNMLPVYKYSALIWPCQDIENGE